MSILFTADLHLTDRVSDEYRWGIFPWLEEMIGKHKVKQIILGGDITDAKDKHSSALTNRMATSLIGLAQVAELIIIRGNHDYIDEKEPFFGFMSKMNTGKGISFITTPTPWPILKNQKTALFLPNTRNYQEGWAKWMEDDFRGFDLIFTHQTFDGCKSETGYTMEGIPPSVFAKYKGKVYSGDIHKPQKVGKNIEYVGAPYRIRFGDDFEPRVLLINDDLTIKDLSFPCLFKATIDLEVPWDLGAAIQKADLQKGDQVKVRVLMPRSAYPEWPDLKRDIIAQSEDIGIALTGPELIGIPDVLESAPKRAKKGSQAASGPIGALDAYAEAKGFSEAVIRAGRGFLKQAMDA